MSGSWFPLASPTHWHLLSRICTLKNGKLRRRILNISSIQQWSFDMASRFVLITSGHIMLALSNWQKRVTSPTEISIYYCLLHPVWKNLRESCFFWSLLRVWCAGIVIWSWLCNVISLHTGRMKQSLVKNIFKQWPRSDTQHTAVNIINMLDFTS